MFSALPFSPNPASIQAAAPSRRPLKPKKPTGRLPRPPIALTRLALAGRIQVVVRAQQLALAVGPAVVHARGQKGTQPHLGRGVPAPHEPERTQAVGHLGPRSSLPGPAPPRATHRGPAPHSERRVRNQVPVCGKGIRSLATREVALTESRKPARDSEGRSEKKGVSEREEGSMWGRDLKNPPTCPHFPDSLAHPSSLTPPA